MEDMYKQQRGMPKPKINILTAEQRIEMLETRVEQLTTVLQDFAAAMFNLSICTPGRTEFDEDLFGELENMLHDLEDLPKLDLDTGR